MGKGRKGSSLVVGIIVMVVRPKLSSSLYCNWLGVGKE